MRMDKDEISRELVSMRRAKLDDIDSYSLAIVDERTDDILHRRTLELPARMSPGDYRIKVMHAEEGGAVVAHEYQLQIDEPVQPAPAPALVEQSDRQDLSELLRMIAQQIAENRELMNRLMDDRERLVGQIIDQTASLANEKVQLYRENNKVLTESFAEQAKGFARSQAELPRQAQPVDVSAERRAELQERWLGFGGKLLDAIPGTLDRIAELRGAGGQAP